jgi:flavin-dependent dehydrogenase
LNQLAFEPDALSHCECTGERRVRTELESPACDSTLTVEEAAAKTWDVAVIGAGPTGALAARQLSLLGLRTLLVDRSSFPREKVCGGCISGLGRRLLESVGLAELLGSSHAAPLGRFDLAAGARRVSFNLPAGAAVSRLSFDAALVRHAVQAGGAFVSGTTTLVRGLAAGCRLRRIVLQQDDRRLVAQSRMVIVADGLGRTSLKQHRAFAPRVAATSRIGLGATLPGTAAEIDSGSVLMSVAHDGYVGLVRVPGDAINLAAAVDPNRVREHGPAETVRQIFIQAGVKPPTGLEAVDWRGTGLLTRHSRRTAASRLLVLGDAAGYVEPFTGEGMTWGMLSAVLAAPLVADWLGRDAAQSVDCLAADCLPADRLGGRRECRRLAHDWSAVVRSQIAPRQRDCRMLAGLLRNPAAVRAAMALIAAAPAIVRPLIGHFWNAGKGIDLQGSFTIQSSMERTRHNSSRPREVASRTSRESV